eukprot:gnl/TRDRNA2_/TRDRNA2_188722_c0_seq1.p1 gnl/TRDRNA2_/TRDRNA2_188722_c0~~gnl/TRDRNA2_/TRDRNA2_188722_c0_seq1.p1  ORF type:complete len:259 (-),score=49.05 gnl/TRDRNA2_/TRDRNA2_188722_c0_seq1:124-837(-)
MSLERTPQLGTKPVALTVKLPPMKNADNSTLDDGLRELYRTHQFCDVSLICAGQTFTAHRVVLASMSEIFRQGLEVPTDPSTGGSRQEVRLADIANPEAVKFMLDYTYQLDGAVWEDYNPRTQEINKDVLRLAQSFRLPGLTQRATHWLAKDLTTGNVVERLTICEDFNLLELREKILEQLTQNKRALSEVANSPQIMKYPKLMQSLLQQAAFVPEEPKVPDPKPADKPAGKKQRKN